MCTVCTLRGWGLAQWGSQGTLADLNCHWSESHGPGSHQTPVSSGRSCTCSSERPKTHMEGVRAQAVPGIARPVPSKTEAKGGLLPCGFEMLPQAHILNLGSSLQHSSVEPLGSVAWLAEGSLNCPDSSLYPIFWLLLQCPLLSG